MFEKNFKIMSNSGDHLKVEIIEEALLAYMRKDMKRNDIVFGVIEKNSDRRASPEYSKYPVFRE
ncbi:MAG: hypothetical protein GF375_07510 [Candidatus Omnitrophica bacterium]|nr:hypothetical protein [Candidatus Omnitrophota bacterium]MBD3269817.1 hypothetical protein [Candidatus Omnitrophota bacterium]